MFSVIHIFATIRHANTILYRFFQHRLYSAWTSNLALRISSKTFQSTKYGNMQTSRDFHSSGLLRRVWWYIPTDVSRKPTSPIFRDQELIIHKLLSSGSWPLEFLTLEDGIDWLSRKSVKIYHYTLRNNPEEHRSQVRWGGSLKSCIHLDVCI